MDYEVKPFHFSDLLRFITSHPLNQDQKIKALMRFVGWQVRCRLTSRPKVHQWVNGSRFLVRRRETGLTGNIYTGLHEFSDMGYLLHVLRSEDLFVDVGSNAGSYTILAASVIGANAYAFEPVPDAHDRLVENVRLNRIEDRVKCLRIALSNEPGIIDFTCDEDTGNHVVAAGEQKDKVIRVERSTLDIILEDESPSVLKIDAEGYETPILEGAAETLKKPSLHSIIMEFDERGSRYGFDESHIVQMILDLGFKSYSYDPLERSLIGLDGKNWDSINTLFVRDESFVTDRLKSAPKVAVHGKSF